MTYKNPIIQYLYQTNIQYLYQNKDSIYLSKFKLPSLVTRSTKFGKFLNDMSISVAKFEMLAFLLSRLNSSVDALVSTSFWETSAGNFKTDVLNKA